MQPSLSLLICDKNMNMFFVIPEILDAAFRSLPVFIL